MADPRAQIHTLMRSLVNRHFPKQANAAKEMADFWHPTGDAGEDYDTADLSRKMNGSRQWTVADVMALQAITGSTRVTDAMRGARQAEAPANPLSSLQHARCLIKESSEGASALMAVSEGGCCGEALAELQDIREAADAAIRDLGAKMRQEDALKPP